MKLCGIHKGSSYAESSRLDGADDRALFWAAPTATSPLNRAADVAVEHLGDFR
jgi:hypothetical protein